MYYRPIPTPLSEREKEELEREIRSGKQAVRQTRNEVDEMRDFFRDKSGRKFGSSRIARREDQLTDGKKLRRRNWDDENDKDIYDSLVEIIDKVKEYTGRKVDEAMDYLINSSIMKNVMKRVRAEWDELMEDIKNVGKGKT